MFNRKKQVIKPPTFDTHRLFNMMLEEKGLYPLTSDLIVLYKDKYIPVEFIYIEPYVCQEIWLS